MTADTDPDEPVTLPELIADRVVATSESAPPEETVSRLFGDHEPHEAAVARETIAKLFGEHDTAESAQVQQEMASFFGVEDAEALETTPNEDGGVACGAADLLGPDEATRHELHVGERVEHAHCIDGALIAAELVEGGPASVHSVDPVSGEAVTFDVTDEAVTVDPEDAVVSMGMADSVPNDADMVTLGIAMGDGETSLESYVDDPLDLFCRNFNAFEDVATYRQWAGDADAVSVAVPATAFASMIRELVSSPAFD